MILGVISGRPNLREISGVIYLTVCFPPMLAVHGKTLCTSGNHGDVCVCVCVHLCVGRRGSGLSKSGIPGTCIQDWNDIF